MEDFFDVIGLDFGTGNRNVDLKKENKKILDKDFKNPTNVEELKAIYGQTLPTSLSTQLGNVPYDIPEGKEIVQAPGLVNRILGKKVIADKDRPKGLLRMAAQLVDTVSGQRTDLDKLGDGTKVDVDSLSRPLSPYQQKIVEKQLKEDFGREKTATEGIKENFEALKDIYPELSDMARKERRKAAIDAQLQYMATEPVRQAFLNRAAEQAMQRGLRVRGALEAMPSNIQNIMTAKQAQRSLASSAFAEEARAAAAQQDAATRFAGLGMQRRFG
jgi:hypothetical protein